MDFDYTTETITPDTTDVLTIGGFGGLEISVGTTAQRPSSPVNGTVRYNTDLNAFEGYQNNTWLNIISTSSSALSSITAAVAANSINNGDNAQTWNWALTTAAKSAFLFTENTASTNGAGSQFLFDIGTITASTANPVRIRAQGNDILNVTNVGAVSLTGATGNTGQSLTLSSGNSTTGNTAGPAVTIVAGNGNGSGTGGAVNITGGATSGGNAVGGTVSITGGMGNGNLAGGDVTISGGGTTGGNAAGSDVTITSGAANGSGTGGVLTLSGGNAPGTGDAGGVVISAGVPTAGSGADVSISASSGTDTNKNGGNLTLTAGDKTGSGTAGVINLIIPATGTLQINSVAGITGQVLSASTGAPPTWTTLSGIAVTTFSAGTTGFTPNTATSGAITLAGTLIAVNGGTGFASYAVGDILAANTTTTLSKIADVATGNALISGGTNTLPSWGKIGLTTHVSGVLAEANGGTNQSTYTTGDLLYASTTNTLSKRAIGTTGQVLTVSGGLPTWTSTAGILQLYKENPSTPTAPTASGTNAVAIGNGSAASATNSIAIGQGTSANANNELAIANGNFATAGDAQTIVVMSRNTTANNTTTELFVDGSAQRLVLPNNSAWTFTTRVVGRRTDATGGWAMYTFVGGITRDGTAATTTLQSSTRTIIDESTAALNCTVTADTTNGSLNINVTGLTAQTFRWVATTEITQVTN